MLNQPFLNNNEHHVPQTSPSSVYQSNFSEYKLRQRQFEREEKPNFCHALRYGLYAVGVLIFVGIAAGLLSGDANNKRYSLTDNPPAEAVKTAIQQINTITEIDIVTEDNDPNHQLRKQGGYTGCLFFTDSNAPETDGANAIERGTDGGGYIEIYANSVDAKKRDEYLSDFDGAILTSGSHTVVGTLVVRTSSHLKASQQKTLEAQLIDVLNGKRFSYVSLMNFLISYRDSLKMTVDSFCDMLDAFT